MELALEFSGPQKVQTSGFLGLSLWTRHPPTPAWRFFWQKGHEPQGRCLCSSHCTVCPQCGQLASRLLWHWLNTREKTKFITGTLSSFSSPGTKDFKDMRL